MVPPPSSDSGRHQRCDRPHFHQHQGALQITAGSGAQAIDGREPQEDGRGDRAVAPRRAADFPVVSRKRYCYGGHSAGLRHEQEHPAVDEGHRRMISLAQIEILPARSGQARGQFRPDEGSQQGQRTARHPDAQDEKRRVHLPCDHARVHEDARPDDAAHHQHGGVEDAELPPDGGFVQGCRLPYSGRRPLGRQLLH